MTRFTAGCLRRADSGPEYEARRPDEVDEARERDPAAIGECEFRLGSFEAALEDTSRAVELARQVAHRAVLAAGHLWQGHALKALNDLGGAELAYERACETARTLDHDAILSTCLRELALRVQARGEALRAAQLEQRGRDAFADRASFLARMRQELAPMWQGRIGAA